jgi:hypothetical protein
MIFEDEGDQNLEPLFIGANVTHLKRGLTFQTWNTHKNFKNYSSL